MIQDETTILKNKLDQLNIMQENIKIERDKLISYRLNNNKECCTKLEICTLLSKSNTELITKLNNLEHIIESVKENTHLKREATIKLKQIKAEISYLSDLKSKLKSTATCEC